MRYLKSSLRKVSGRCHYENILDNFLMSKLKMYYLGQLLSNSCLADTLRMIFWLNTSNITLFSFEEECGGCSLRWEMFRVRRWMTWMSRIVGGGCNLHHMFGRGWHEGLVDHNIRLRWAWKMKVLLEIVQIMLKVSMEIKLDLLIKFAQKMIMKVTLKISYCLESSSRKKNFAWKLLYKSGI